MKKVSMVIPMYYEEQVAEECYKRVAENLKKLSDYDYEIIFVNDGSKDKTLDILEKIAKEDKNVKIISFSRNFGHQAAVTAGLKNVSGDVIVIMDADLQDPPELIPEMIKYWEEGYDDVYAQRKSRAGESFMKKITSKMYYRLLQALTPVPIQKDTGDFRLLDRRCVNALKKLRETDRNSKSMFSWIGYKKKAIMYDRDARIAGKTKWSYKKLINLAIDGITSFTTSPLRISTYIAIPTFLALFVYFIYVIIKCIKLNVAIQAFQAIILLVLFFSGVQILLFGIIGEYLGRIFNASKNRPLYLVNEYNGQREENE